MNLQIIHGQVSDPPELRTTQGGKQVLNLNVVTVEHFKVQGEDRERRDYHKVVVWGDEAADLSARIFEGAEVVVCGSTRHGSYQNQHGEKKKTTEIKPLRGGVKICGEPLESRPQVGRNELRAPAKPEAPDTGGFDNDDDIPF